MRVFILVVITLLVFALGALEVIASRSLPVAEPRPNASESAP